MIITMMSMPCRRMSQNQTEASPCAKERSFEGRSRTKEVAVGLLNSKLARTLLCHGQEQEQFLVANPKVVTGCTFHSPTIAPPHPLAHLSHPSSSNWMLSYHAQGFHYRISNHIQGYCWTCVCHRNLNQSNADPLHILTIRSSFVVYGGRRRAESSIGVLHRRWNLINFHLPLDNIKATLNPSILAITDLCFK